MRTIEAIRESLAELGGPGRLTLEFEGSTATLTLNNPGASNALSGRMMAALLDVVEELERWEQGCVLVARGEGTRAFCAGADLNLVRAWQDRADAASEMCHYMQEVTRRISDLPLLTVAAIDGAALGGGAELSTAFDYRVIARSGRIGFVHARLGLSPGWGGGARLVGLVGARKALHLLSQAAVLDAEAARAVGLVDDIAPDGEAARVALELVAPALEYAPEAVRAAKRLVRAAAPPIAYDVEGGLFASLFGGPANREALDGVKQGR